LTNLLPPAWKDDVRIFEEEVARVFGGFIRSQLLIGLSYSILTWVTLLILGVPNGFLISMLTGVIMIIPFAGPYLALLPPIALTLLEVHGNALPHVLLLLIIMLFVAQQLVMQVLAPRIMSQGVGLHPLWLFAALLAGARIAGVWGAFFAPPIAALVVVIISEAHTRWMKHSELFREPPTNHPAQTAAPSNGQSLIQAVDAGE
jgi:predicted PurR-regulated permease PerM